MHRLLLLLILFIPAGIRAESYTLELIGKNSIIGNLSYVTVEEGETLVDIARKYDLGYDELIKANSDVNRWVPEPGERVLLPKMFILPDARPEGIVINLAELRLYYFVPSSGGNYRKVYTYPISVGRMDWRTPLGKTSVLRKEENPAWYPPISIREEHFLEGEELPEMIPGGVPENPLGNYALKLALTGYLIHGTDKRKEYGIGMRVTHGCIRMYPEDIKELFDLVTVGTPVLFVDQPIKFGWLGASLYAEVHTPLKEDEEDFAEYSHLVTNGEIFDLFARYEPDLDVDKKLLRDLIVVGDGIPVKVRVSSSGLPPSRE